MGNLNNTEQTGICRSRLFFKILLGLSSLFVVLLLLTPFIFVRPMFKPVGIHPDYQHDVTLMFVHDKSTAFLGNDKIYPLFIVFRDGLILISKNQIYSHRAEVLEDNLSPNDNNACDNTPDNFILFRISQEELVGLMKSIDDMIPQDVMAIDKGAYNVDCSHYQLFSFWNEKVLLLRIPYHLWNQDTTFSQHEIYLGNEDELRNKAALQNKGNLQMCSDIFVDLVQLYSNANECFPAKISDYEPPKQNSTIFLTQEIEISTTQGITIKKKIPIPEMSRLYVLLMKKNLSTKHGSGKIVQ